jgi:hypothetical protein
MITDNGTASKQPVKVYWTANTHEELGLSTMWTYYKWGGDTLGGRNFVELRDDLPEGEALPPEQWFHPKYAHLWGDYRLLSVVHGGGSVHELILAKKDGFKGERRVTIYNPRAGKEATVVTKDRGKAMRGVGEARKLVWVYTVVPSVSITP